MSDYSRYQDAMVVQQRLLSWSRSAPGQAYLRGYFESSGAVRGSSEEEQELLARVHVAGLEAAEPVYVSVEACELVDYATQTFVPEAVLPGDPFTPNGFALLARPLMLQDAVWSEDSPGRSPTGFMPIRAISWQSIHEDDLSRGMFDVCYYVDALDEDASVACVEHAATDQKRHEIDVWREATQKLREGGQTLTVAHQFMWSWGSSPWDDQAMLDEWASVTGEAIDDVRDLARSQVVMVQTFWRLASQFRPLPERAPRGIWRDYSRRVHAGKDVTVVRLRRGRESEQAEPAGRGLSVQFPVRGHWRNQHFASLGPASDQASHRQIWISPYVKGPDGAPFVVKPRVWEFTR